MADDVCLQILLAPFAIVWIILCILLANVGGSVVSVFVTFTIFILSLIYTPLHICKTMYMTATTDKCFKGIRGHMLRFPVFLCVPLAHILFLILITTFSATIGTLYYIGICTQVVYKHAYLEESFDIILSDLMAEPKSNLGEYLKRCQEYMTKDEESLVTIGFVKGCVAIVIAFFVSFFAIVPFTLATVTITLYRLPINFFKTMKIALFTVVLKYDLRLVVLLTLPLTHALFPLVVFIASLIWSFFWTWKRTYVNLMKDKSPFRKWELLLVDGVIKYYEEHKAFVSDRCDPYDHITGIPYGWNGNRYGFLVERILRFQLNFLLVVILFIVQTPIILVVGIVFVSLKYVPACVSQWINYLERTCGGGRSGLSCAAILILSPFLLLQFILIPVEVLIGSLVLVPLCAIRGLFMLIEVRFFDNWTICESLHLIWDLIVMIDKYSEIVSGVKFIDCKDIRVYYNDRNRGPNSSWSNHKEKINADLYWDRFASQCIQTTADLLVKGFLDSDAIEGMDPACVQSIPCVAIWMILFDTLSREGIEKGDIFWKLDENVCKAKDRPPLDNIMAHLWPMVVDLQSLLERQKKKLQQSSEQTEVMQALLCDNHGKDKSSETLKLILEELSNDEKQRALYNEIRNKISRIVLVILRVRPFQSRMEKIFQHQYDDPNKPIIEAAVPDDDATTKEANTKQFQKIEEV